MGKLCFHEGDYLFHSDNISRSQAIEFSEALQTTGYFTGANGVARIVRTDECYVLYGCFSGDSETYKTQEYNDEKQAATILFQSELFAGASTKLLGCELNLQPIDGLEWTAEGLLPGQRLTSVDNINVVYDESLTPEIATAVATRVPLRDESAESTITLELSGNGNEYDCRFVGDKDYTGELNEVLRFWGREIFSEIPNAKSLKIVIVEEEAVTPFLEKEITVSHGRYMLIHENRLFYPDNTPQTVLDALQQGMQSLGMCDEDSAYLIRLTHEAETYTVQMAFLEAPEDELARPFLKEVGECFAEAAFPDEQLRLEITDLNFDLFSDYAWQTDAQVSSIQTPAIAR